MVDAVMVVAGTSPRACAPHGGLPYVIHACSCPIRPELFFTKKETKMPYPTPQFAPLTRDALLLSRKSAARLGRATKDIVERGWYFNEFERQVDIAAARDDAKLDQVAYRPGQPIAMRPIRHAQFHTAVFNQPTLTVAHARHLQGHRVALLNFASPITPGGGWLRGSRAQEESLARASALAHCLSDDIWYYDSRHARNPFYDDTVIVTPQVPFFRQHEGDLLATPWQADVLTAAAVHARAVRRYMPARESEIPRIMLGRAIAVLRAACTLDADVLVLGAWGCGNFGNAPTLIATVFREAFNLVDMRTFAQIDFAVADVRTPPLIYQAFAEMFGGATGMARTTRM
jgi:uncharacterized protein (TIGR02452 family)